VACDTSSSDDACVYKVSRKTAYLTSINDLDLGGRNL